jgi:membrane protein implicated in regulation of membrane protease activity
VTAFAGIIGPIFFANVFARSIDPAYGFDLPGLGFWLAGAVLLAAFVLAGFLTRQTHPENNPPADEVLQD